MLELIQKLGLNWKLLLAQGVNFLVILLILRFTVYQPLVKVLNERRRRIEKGLKDAEDAGKGLSEVEAVRKEKIAEAEQESIVILSRVEGEAKQREAGIIEEARLKEIEILKNAEKSVEVRKRESEEKFYGEAAVLVRLAVAKTAGLAPTVIDESLVAEALREVKKLPR